jgi:hypothetical protein
MWQQFSDQVGENAALVREICGRKVGVRTSGKPIENALALTVLDEVWIGFGTLAICRACSRPFAFLLRSRCLRYRARRLGWSGHAHLLVADPPGMAAAPPRSGVRVTYFGTNAYLLEARDATLLVDPYFSRMSLCRAAFNLRATPQKDVIERHLGQRQITGILATHGHFDHLLDVPEIMNRSGAKLIASPRACGSSKRAACVSALQGGDRWERRAPGRR